MTEIIGFCLLAALFALVVGLNIYARRAKKERLKRGEPEPDLEIEIW